MAWKLEIHFSDGSSELVDEDFETDYSGPFGAICPDFESHHSGE